ncbi:ATPase, partial [Stachybotrys elegans]
ALTSSWVEDSEKLIQAAFTLARKLSPCVIFINEADSGFRRRTNSDGSWERASITQFVSEMDGLAKNSDNTPFVLVATNRPMDLNDAFLRRLPQ